MPEDYVEPTSQPFDLARLLGIVRRRHIAFLLVLLLVWAAIWGFSWSIRPKYRSGTLILVEEPTMPKNYVVPNVNDDLQGRLQSMQQQILSRTRLLMIIDRLDLYNSPKERGLTPDDRVERMRKDIMIELVRARDDGAITAFRVSYTAPDPHVAQAVTNQLTTLFIKENLKLRQEQSEGTTRFIQDQLEAARANLAQQEAKVRDFQTMHQGELPSQQTTNLQILSGLQAQYQSEQDALNSAKQQRVYSQTLVDQYRSLHSATARKADGTPTGLDGLDRQLESMRAKLAELSTHYTDSYPDVQALKREIAKTERARENVLAEIQSRPKDAEVKSEPVDPAQNAPLLQLEGQLHATQNEIENREQAMRELSGRIAEYQRRLNGTPASEQQLADLTRGYEQSKANYDDLLKKENESKMATSMEQMQQGGRFTVLDPPTLPLKPVSPNRLKFCALGVAAGLFLGALMAGALELLDSRMHSEEEIKRLLPVAVISEVPQVLTPAEERRGRGRLFLGWAMAALVLVSILAGSVFSFLHT